MSPCIPKNLLFQASVHFHICIEYGWKEWSISDNSYILELLQNDYENSGDWWLAPNQWLATVYTDPAPVGPTKISLIDIFCSEA